MKLFDSDGLVIRICRSDSKAVPWRIEYKPDRRDGAVEFFGAQDESDAAFIVERLLRGFRPEKGRRRNAGTKTEKGR